MPVIEGIIERITFYNEDNSFTVARLQEGAKGSLTTVVGNLPGISAGESLRLAGEWIKHPEYGTQFRVESAERIAPATLLGMERYLGSGMIKGIGPVIARKIVRAFGLAALDIIRAKPERLTSIGGIGPKKAERIAQAVAAQKEISDILIFLQGCGITANMAAKIYRAYGRNAVAVIRENPYRLAEEVFGIGFKTADSIAAKLGVDPASPHRVKAGLIYLLEEYCRGGHVYSPEEEFCAGAAAELGIPLELTREAVCSLVDERRFFLDRDEQGDSIVYPSYLYHAERGAAARILELLNQPLPPRAADPDALLDQIEAVDGCTLAPAQRQAVLAAVKNGVAIITGGPGTGKTTALRSLLRLYAALGIRFLLAAPTGRAAKRLAEATGYEAKTIHRLLEYGGFAGGAGGFQRNEDNPLDAEAVVIDEVSMVDILLFHNLLKAVTRGTRLVLVGDADQLPSVGPGNVLRDLLAARVIPCVRLNTIFRQGEASLIALNAHRINHGEMPILPAGDKDFYFVPCEDPQKIVAELAELVAERLPRYMSCDPIEDIQVLTPMRRTITGADHLNQLLQERLNPAAPGKSELSFGALVVRERDKVMQIRNNYQKMVFNGDMGRVRMVDREEGQLHVAFPEAGGERLVVYEREELDELTISYAISVHKSQGSEYPVVVLPLTTQHYMMLQRNLLYTAVSRARRLMVLIGTRKALAIAVRNNKVEERNTLLAERIGRR